MKRSIILLVCLTLTGLLIWQGHHQLQQNQAQSLEQLQRVGVTCGLWELQRLGELLPGNEGILIQQPLFQGTAGRYQPLQAILQPQGWFWNPGVVSWRLECRGGRWSSSVQALEFSNLFLHPDQVIRLFPVTLPEPLGELQVSGLNYGPGLLTLSSSQGTARIVMEQTGGYLRLQLTENLQQIEVTDWPVGGDWVRKLRLPGEFQISDVRITGSLIHDSQGWTGQGKLRGWLRGAEGKISICCNWQMQDSRLTLSESTDCARISGTIDVFTGQMDLQCDFREADLGLFGRLPATAQSLLGRYSLSGIGDVSVRLKGMLSHPDYRGDILLRNGVLRGDPGYPNLINLQGEVSFDTTELQIASLRGDLAGTRMEIAGNWSIAENQPHVQLDMNLEEMEFDSLAPLLVDQGYGIAQYASGGRASLELRLEGSPDHPQIRGRGRFNAMSLPLLPDLLELRPVTGQFRVDGEQLHLEEFHGFWANAPFRGQGVLAPSERRGFSLNLQFRNFTHEDLDPSITASLSRLRFGGGGRADFSLHALRDELTMEVSFTLRGMETHLHPLPVVLAVDRLRGQLGFERTKDGAILFTGGNLKYGESVEVRLRTPALSGMPVVLSGRAGGEVKLQGNNDTGIEFSSTTTLTGASLRLTDRDYNLRQISLQQMIIRYSYQKRNLQISAGAQMLGGSLDLSGRADFGLKEDARFTLRLKDADLDGYYRENPSVFRMISGKLQGRLLYTFDRGEPGVELDLTATQGELHQIGMLESFFEHPANAHAFHLPYERFHLDIFADRFSARIRHFDFSPENPELSAVLQDLRTEIPLIAPGSQEFRFYRLIRRIFMPLSLDVFFPDNYGPAVKFLLAQDAETRLFHGLPDLVRLFCNYSGEHDPSFVTEESAESRDETEDFGEQNVGDDQVEPSSEE